MVILYMYLPNAAGHEYSMSFHVQAVSSEPSVGPWCLKMVHLLSQEASRLLRMPLEVSSVSLKANRQKLQVGKSIVYQLISQ